MSKHVLWILLLGIHTLHGQLINDFISLPGGTQDFNFHLPDTHTFQYIIEHGDSIDIGGTMDDNFDFTGYVPINGSSTSGYLSINHEKTPGGVTIMDFNFDSSRREWIYSSAEAVDFSLVNGTARNCSGTVTPWGTIVSSEERIDSDPDGDGYNNLGWNIEIDPVTRKVIDHPGGLNGADKLWALGNFRHENIAVHENNRTVYQAEDVNGGNLFKFVAHTAGDLSSGNLYVYDGPKSGNGQWIQLNNSTPLEQNTVRFQADAVGAVNFNGGEDVEISPIDGKIYFAVKGENRVYRFTDDSPLTGGTVSNFETYVGGMSYTFPTSNGNTTENWGTGNDNLTFDNDGNLYVLQDGSDNHIWFVGLGHTQLNPKVKIFARIPAGAEPTGMTFTPDNRYMFLSIQHPSAANEATSQIDALGEPRKFDKDVALVIARKGFLGKCPLKYDITSPHTNNYNFVAFKYITSSALIDSSLTLRYFAGDNILLESGFEVKKSAIFHADIHSCL